MKNNENEFQKYVEIARDIIDSSLDPELVDVDSTLDEEDVSQAYDAVWVRCWLRIDNETLEDSDVQEKKSPYRVCLTVEEYDAVYDSYSTCEWYEIGGEAVIGGFEDQATAASYVSKVKEELKKLRENQLICNEEIEQDD